MTAPLPQRLRTMLAAKRLHFRPAGASEDCYAILATAERLQDLELAASELERMQALAAVESVTIDGADLQLLTHDQVREQFMTVKFEQRGELEINRVLDDLCQRLGVEL